jgi:hypothetical protein
MNATSPWTFGWDALVALGTIGLALFAFVQLRAFSRSERRRTQPVVVANAGSITSSSAGLERLSVFLTNHGTGTAYNVRFGVRLDGREFAVGGGRGTRYTVPAGDRLPDAADLEVDVDVYAYVASRKGRGVYERRVFWARYENAFGQVWETANPADPFADFDIFPSSAWRRWLIERRQRFGRWFDQRIVNRWVREELEASQEERDLSRWQRVRRWLERRFR